MPYAEINVFQMDRGLLCQKHNFKAFDRKHQQRTFRLWDRERFLKQGRQIIDCKKILISLTLTLEISLIKRQTKKAKKTRCDLQKIFSIQLMKNSNYEYIKVYKLITKTQTTQQING